MIKYQDVVQDRNGNAVVGAEVRVYATGTANLATISATDGGASINQTLNPVTTDADGDFAFYVAAGSYDIAVIRGGYDTVTQSDIKVGSASLAASVVTVEDVGTYFVGNNVEAILQEVGLGLVGPTWTQYQQTDYYSTTSDLATTGRVYADGGFEVQGGASYLAGEVEIAGQLVEFCEPLGASVAINAGLGSMFYKTASAPATFTFAVGTASEQSVVSFTLEITNSGGARTITWPASVVWPSPGTVPTPTTGVDVYTFYTRDQGVTWRGALVGSYAS